MIRRRPWRLVLIGVSALVVTLLAGASVATTVVVRRPLPQTSGDVDVSGLDARVTVLRDARGVPQVYADTAADLFRAQGWVHAQDRFFEMDWRRHVTAGRLSELVGANPDALLADKVIRTLGWRQVAETEVAQADPTTREYLAAYAEGVNAYLATRSPAQLSLQYSLLGVSVDLPEIEPWTPADSVAWFKAMAWDLRGNYDDELERARVYGAVRDVARVEQLFPPYPFDVHAPILAASDVRTGPPPAVAGEPAAAHARTALVAASAPGVGPLLRNGSALRALDAARRAVESVPHLLGRSEGTGSNSWAVAGRLTATGKPLLANDPHLAPSLPGVWYQAGLHCRQVSSACPFDVAGYTFAGVPGVVIGHNRTIAWAMTNLGPDVTDFYLERTRGGTVARDGAWEPLTARTETIRVAGAHPVTVTVRSSSHGPLLSDVLADLAPAATSGAAPDAGETYAVSLAWTALTPGHDMDAVFAVDVARDFPQFRAGVLRLDVPAQNMLYADNLGDHGHVGYQAPGRIPVRGRGPARAGGVPVDGSWPLPGWDSRYDWKGVVPSDRLPWTLDPAAGYLVAANQAVTPPGGIAFTRDFDYGWRSQRIRDLVGERTANGRLMTVADMASIQTDTRNPIWPALERLVLTARVDAFTAEGRDLLRGWDGSEPVGSGAALYFNAFWTALLDRTFRDELPDGDGPNGGQRWMQVVTTLLDRPDDRWWDDTKTPDVVETRDEIVREALVDARLRLTREQGKDTSLWSWGGLHTLSLQAVPTGTVGATGPLHWLLNAGPVAVPGGSAVVDAMGYDASTGSFAVTAAPSMRMVVDLADLDRSRWVNQTGQSAHPGSPHYTDQLEAWATGETFGWPFGPVAVRQAAVETLTLRPPG